MKDSEEKEQLKPEKSVIEKELEGQSQENFSAKKHYEDKTAECVDGPGMCEGCDCEKSKANFEDVEVEEFTEEILKGIDEKDANRIKQKAFAKAAIKFHNNGVNDWKLISRVDNEFLDWNITTTAMDIPGLGVVLCVREGLQSKLSITTQLLEDCEIIEFDYMDEDMKVEKRFKIEKK